MGVFRRFSHLSFSQTNYFKEFLDQRELIEIEFKGEKFTWTNKQYKHNLFLQRLDRAYANYERRSVFEKAFVLHEKLIVIVLHLNNNYRRGNYFFRFEAKWLQNQD